MIYHAAFRFYEELNDFLPPSQQKVSFNYSFKQNPSVKDAIEALGVPHTEVDLIIVNEKSVDFNYLLQDGDRISVYPVFEAIDISPVIHCREKPLRKNKFILDVHLGKLARYLRLLGFDTYYETDSSDQGIIALALKEQRIILTRDKGLLKNKLITHGFWVRATDPNKQILEILNRLDLSNNIQPFTRCLSCNGGLISTSKERVSSRLLPKTKQYFEKFMTCSRCAKIYWQGSHYQRMQQFVDRFFR